MRSNEGRATGAEYLLRQAKAADLEEIYRLARLLDSVNLPADRRELRRLIRISSRSFAGAVKNKWEATYLFVAQKAGGRRLAGVSAVIAQHGTPASPHFYLEIVEDHHHSRTLNRTFLHKYLLLRKSLDGPTELGGLVVDRRARHTPAKVGKQLSLVRLLYMAIWPRRFRSHVIAEIKPRLTSSGENLLWEHYGKRVTGLSFRRADRLSRADKEFIDALFPSAPIYTCMLPLRVQRALGQPAPEARPALRILEQAGLRFLSQIDPFDGGPYYGCEASQTAPARNLKQVVAESLEEAIPHPQRLDEWLVAAWDRRGFRAVRSPGELAGRAIRLPRAFLQALEISAGHRVAAIPFS